jgi:oligoribonuclease (3'-5' exoribonuclease)
VKDFTKQASHLALADIHDSIRELQFYRKRLFVIEAQGVDSPDLGDMPA